MDDFLLRIGRLSGLVGVIISAVAMVRRATGMYALGSFQASTLLLVGMAAMLAGCLCFLAALTNRKPVKP